MHTLGFILGPPYRIQVQDILKGLRDKENEALAGLHRDLEINLAEIVALTVLLRLRAGADGIFQETQPTAEACENLRNALEGLGMELASTEMQLSEEYYRFQGTAEAPWAGAHAERCEVQRLCKQWAATREHCSDECLAFSQACVAEEQRCLSEALMKLEAAEEQTASEFLSEEQMAAKSTQQWAELRDAQHSQRQLEDCSEFISHLEDVALRWEAQAECHKRAQRDLTERELAEKALQGHRLEELEELEIQMATRQQSPSFPESELRIHTERVQAAQAKSGRHTRKNRQEAESLSRTLSDLPEVS